MFSSSIREFISNSFKVCDCLETVAFVCTFIETKIPLIVKRLIEEDTSNDELITKTKRAIHGSLFYFSRSLGKQRKAAP